jgi:hypothetical protein
MAVTPGANGAAPIFNYDKATPSNSTEGLWNLFKGDIFSYDNAKLATGVAPTSTGLGSALGVPVLLSWLSGKLNSK